MKLIYIAASPKEQSFSTSKQIGLNMVDTLKQQVKGLEVISHDLFYEDLPEIRPHYFGSRAKLDDEQMLNSLSEVEQQEIIKIKELAYEFRSGDIYVIATPMWNTMFPYKLKQYFDLVFLEDIVIKIDSDENKATGLMGEKTRHMVYIQSSGGSFPALLNRVVNHGLCYVKDTFSFLGVTDFYKILVEGVDNNKNGTAKAHEDATNKIKEIADSISFDLNDEPDLTISNTGIF